MRFSDVNTEFIDKGGAQAIIDELKAYIDGVSTGEVDLSSYVTKQELQDKLDALQIDVDLSAYATKEELETAISSIDLSAYATKVEIPTVPTNVSAFTNDSGYLTEVPDEYVTDTELEAKGYLTEHQDLSDYATKSEIPSLEGYAKITDIPAKVSELENDSGYLTEAPDLSSYALKTEIPSLDGYATKTYVDTNKFSGSYNDLTDKPTIPSAVAVKGNSESAYRTGNVNLTPENIGAVATGGNTAENTVVFTSADSTTATAWTDVSTLTTGEKHSSIFNKVSTMFKNIRFLYKMLGTTNISSIGDGTVTNAISTLNSNLPKCSIIVAANITQNLNSGETGFGMYDAYALLQPDYSSLSGKKILASILTHVGTDTTDSNGTVTQDVFVSDVSSADGIKINQIRVFSFGIRTIRAKILVLYTD